MVGEAIAMARWIATISAAVVVIASACTPSAPSASTSPPAKPAATSAVATSAPAAAAATNPAKPAAASPKPGGRVILGSSSDAKVLSPVHSTEVNSSDIHGRIYESLIDVDVKTGQPVPRLAEKFEVAPDNTTLNFTLRNDLKWSDGSAFSGEDFTFTVEAVMRSKQTVRKSIFQDIVGAQDYAEGKADRIAGITVAGNSITVKLKQPFCPGLINIGGFGIIPKSVFGKYMDPKDTSKNIDEAPELRSPPLAMGPFKLKEWVPNDHITLVRNDLFWGQKAYLDEFVYKILPDQTAQASAVKTGEIDITTIEPKDLEDIKRTDTLNVYSYADSGYTQIRWNLARGGKEFLQSTAVRQALAYGLNMDLVIEKVLFGEGKRTVAHTPPVSWAYDPAGLSEYKYDAQKAQQLLEQDGWKKGADSVYEQGGQKLEFTMITNSGNKVRETLLQVAVEQYKLIGVKVNPLTESFEAVTERNTKSADPVYGDQGARDFDAIILGWSLGADPDAYTIWHSSQVKRPGLNYSHYKNEVVDKALEDGRTKCALADRKAAYQAFNKQLNEDQPYNFGYAPNVLLVANKRLQGLDPGPFRRLSLWNIEQWSKN
jgi:peptide/nickel transport system substrate-binding protein